MEFLHLGHLLLVSRFCNYSIVLFNRELVLDPDTLFLNRLVSEQYYLNPHFSQENYFTGYSTSKPIISKHLEELNKNLPG